MSESDPAAARFWTLQALRFLGAGMALLGVVIMSGGLLDTPVVGSVLLVLGALEFFLVPPLLARRWRSEKP